MLVLNDLRDKPKSRKNYKRVGRGKSNSPGHGGKGQTARTGVALGNFQGGQTPIERRLPKHKQSFFRLKMTAISLGRIDAFVKKNNLSNPEITRDVLAKIGFVKKNEKFKIIGKCSAQFSVHSHEISAGALASLQANNGKHESITN